MGYSQALEMQLSLLRYFREEYVGEPAIYDPTERERDYYKTAQGASRILMERATPYYWAPDICDMVGATSATMPPYTLRQSDLPSMYGYCYFARPITLPTSGDRMTGFGWWADPSDVHGLWTMAFVATDDFLAGRMDSCGMWSYGTTHSELIDGGLLDADRHHGGEAQRSRIGDEVRIVAACFAFMQQSILVTRDERAERSTRKRAGAVWADPPLIRVVRLRRLSQSRAGVEDGEAVEWSCRWVVSGHWRQQYYPSTDEHRPLFILPYVKGPEDAPLKPPRAKVFAVVR